MGAGSARLAAGGFGGVLLGSELKMRVPAGYGGAGIVLDALEAAGQEVAAWGPLDLADGTIAGEIRALNGPRGLPREPFPRR